MQPITTSDELKNAIQILEFDRQVKERQLREHVCFAIESLKPANLIRSTMHKITSSPYLIENILGTAAGLVSGHISKNIVTGKSASIARKFWGTILQFVVTNVVARHFLKK